MPTAGGVPFSPLTSVVVDSGPVDVIAFPVAAWSGHPALRDDATDRSIVE
jgi:hypothetical protein